MWWSAELGKKLKQQYRRKLILVGFWCVWKNYMHKYQLFWLLRTGMVFWNYRQFSVDKSNHTMRSEVQEFILVLNSYSHGFQFNVYIFKSVYCDSLLKYTPRQIETNLHFLMMLAKPRIKNSIRSVIF